MFSSALICAISLSSCGTLFQGGQATSYQTTKPKDGQPSREIKTGALIADILLFPPSLILDFANGKIYREQPKK